MSIENKNYKNTVFRMVFNNKQYLLDLYNAINGTSYTNPDDLTITTLSGEPSVELVVTALNVNEGHNKELMEACDALKG